MHKAVIMGGYRHTVESPRKHCPQAELWLQSTSARAWNWILYDWSRWFDVHTVGPQSFYPGIRNQRPDVLDWYYRQGSERPIYLTEKHPDIIGSVAYPVDDIETRLDAKGRFGCQLDYMAALAFDEGFDTWILYGIGQPYARDRESKQASHYLKHHGMFPFYWLRRAYKQGVTIVLDVPESNVITLDMITDEERYPTPDLLPQRYGFDMGVERSQLGRDAKAEYAFGAANG